jgi:multimeric flavodoxin WrbA
MKVTAYIGSARKKHTYKAAETVLNKLKTYGEVETEIISLNDYNIETCIGCKTCLDKGEELCKFKDDRNLLIEKMMQSDGVIFASPNYSFHVSAIMKIFLDRLGFVFHRPQFFGKTFTSIVAQGIYGGNKIVKYFNFIGNALGFNTVNGSCIKTLEPMTDKAVKIADKKLDKLSKRFYKQLIKNQYPTPSIFELMIFRMSRTSMKMMLNEDFRDYNHYKEKGWFKSDFFYPVKLNFLKQWFGKLFDFLAVKITK